MPKNIVFTHSTVDHETGEILQSKYVKREIKDTDEFFLTYIEHIGLIVKLPYFQLQTLLCLAPNIEWETGEFTLDSKTMERVVECSGLKEGSIRNAVSKLKQRNIIQRKKTNWYMLNPEIFWKGSEISRQKKFELTYQWTIKD